MTLKGAIAELQLLLKANDMPIYYKPCIEKVIETIQMEWTYQMSRLDEMERRIELHEKAMEKAMRDTADTPQTERNADQHVQRVEYVGDIEKKRCRTCRHFEGEFHTPISSDGTYYPYVICTAKECHYESVDTPQTEQTDCAWE